MNGKWAVQIIGLSWLLTFLSCTEIHPIQPVDCLPASVEQNIVGTWHYKATYAVFDGAPTSGSITFESDKTIIDPNFILESNEVRSNRWTVFKQYAVTDNSVAIRTTTKNQIIAILFLVVQQNTCDKIVLKPAYGQDSEYIELTDKMD